MSPNKPTILPIVPVAVGFTLTEEMVITVANRIGDPKDIATRGHVIALDRSLRAKGEPFCLLPFQGRHPVTGEFDFNLCMLVWDFYPSLNGYFAVRAKTRREHVENWFKKHGGIEGINLDHLYGHLRVWPFSVCQPEWMKEKIDTWLHRLNKQRRIPALLKKPSKEEAKNMLYLRSPPQLWRRLQILPEPGPTRSSES